MDLNKTGKLLYDLRKGKGLTQKQVAEKLGIMPKTVSKWETGKGFPDVSYISGLSDIYGVSERILLSGTLLKNTKNAGNIKRTQFYICKQCGSIVTAMGECSIMCCGSVLEAEKINKPDEIHSPEATVVENDFYIEFNHDMTKEHYISFVTYINYDRALTIKLYPEQGATVRFPKMYGGKLYFYCTKHGLFEYKC